MLKITKIRKRKVERNVLLLIIGSLLVSLIVVAYEYSNMKDAPANVFSLISSVVAGSIFGMVLSMIMQIVPDWVEVGPVIYEGGKVIVSMKGISADSGVYNLALVGKFRNEAGQYVDLSINCPTELFKNQWAYATIDWKDLSVFPPCVYLSLSGKLPHMNSEHIEVIKIERLD